MRRPTLLLAMVAALLAAGCGQDPGTDVTFESWPPAQVTIDGNASGTTPLTIALAPGSHKVVYSAAGYRRWEFAANVGAGGPAKFGATLVVDLGKDASDTTAIAALAKALDVECAPAETPEIHRGGGKTGTVLFWPKDEIRKEGLRTFRIDVDPDYAGDGALEFRKGKEVLYSAPFDPKDAVTTGRIPSEVLEGVDVGDVVSWGIYFEDRRQAPIEAKFKVVREAKVEKRMQKLEGSKHFSSQPRIAQEMLKADVLRDSGMHSEALAYYLAIARTWPESTLPYTGLATSARNLGLKDTALYAEATKYALRGNRVGLGGGVGGAAGAFGSAGGDLPKPLAGPTLADLGVKLDPGDEDLPTAGGGATATAPDAGSATAEAGSTGAVAQATSKHMETLASDMEDRAREREDAAKMLEESAKKVRAAEQKLSQAEQDRRAAQQQARDARARLDEAMARAHEANGTEGEAAAKEELSRARAEMDKAMEKARQADEAAEKARRDLDDATLQNGGMNGADAQIAAEKALREAENARRLAEEAKKGSEALAAGGGAGDAAAAGNERALRETADFLDQRAREARQQAEDLRSTAEEAKKLREAEAKANGAVQEALKAARAAHERLQKAMMLAEESKGKSTEEAANEALRRSMEAAAEAERAHQEALDKLQDVQKRRSEKMASLGGKSPEAANAAADDADRRAEEAERMAADARKAADAGKR